MELAGTSVLVTGGSGGLGAAAVRRFHAAGAHVVIADLSGEAAEKTAADLGERAIPVATDVLDSASVDRALAAAQAAAPLRTVLTAHGAAGGKAQRIVGKTGEAAPLEAFESMIAGYLTGTYNVLRLAAASMAGNEPVDEDGLRGAVITTASIAAYEGQIGLAPYASAKGGVVSLTLVAARDLGAVGVRVCCIAPGTMRTATMESVGEEALAAFGKAVPFPKRLGSPDEYAALAQHIAENDYLNGEVIRLDGAQRFGPR
ncbi:SDR family NAD(P)-dependent oxidoreductase [Pseudonocardia sp. NPDC049154]|uniref:SDR family NAD(P)-dependent oxidoreductase n=1 Tax=Pseudonocardia sp. NPDC049154 TaxID=3155501 RepID=UPI0033D463F8